ncbi:uncharacterized protein [Channa argus]|uniref:uncharacterized protein n=1 Tax=Channa argus TaxID=215402 RepID=UPI003522FB35
MELVELGKIKTESNSKSDRLSVTENCSLVIKKVTDEDVGRYTCRQIDKSGQQQGSHSVFDVSVVTVTGQFYSFTVRDGDDVTLPCGNVRDDQEKCDRTYWLFSDSGNKRTVSLFELGKIKPESNSKSHRLSVTENCSLVIKKVTDEDVGLYTCRQFESGRQQGSGSEVDVSVVTRTGHKNDDKVTLTCSVWTHGHCGHTVKWLYDDNKNEFTDTETPQSSCSVTVTLTTSDLNQKYSDLLKCEVTDGFSGEVQQFTFRRPSSGGTSGEERKTTTTTTTTTTTVMKETTSKVTTKKFATNKRNTTKHATTSVKSTSTISSKVTPTVKTRPSGWRNSTDPTKEWLRSIIVSVGLAALIISVVTVNMWTRTKGNKTQTEDNTVDNDEDEGEGTVKYENVGDASASVRL